MFELFIVYDMPIACHLSAPLSLDSCVKSMSVIGYEEDVGSANHLVDDYHPSHSKYNFLPNRCPPCGRKRSFPRRPQSYSFPSSPVISFVLGISQHVSIGGLALLVVEDLVVEDARQDRTPTGQFVIGSAELVAEVTGIDSSLKHSQVCKETRTYIR